MEMKSKFFDELNTVELYEILRSRAEIFVVEQNCVYQDLDTLDYRSLHVFYEEEGRVTACLRAFPIDDETVQVGRVLTLEHGKRYGERLLREGLDEFEALRLLDHEGLTQEACAIRMNVARTTVTAIYDSARKKIADTLVNGKRLLITGGHFAYEPVELAQRIMEKGPDTMRIAVTYENGEIFQHFGHTAQFKLYDVEDGKIVGEQIVDTNGSGHGALAGFLQAVKADALICGGIGMGAQMALADAGIRLYAGVQGSADAAAKALSEGNLEYDPDAHCDHHGHHHDGDCGHEHCEEHHCKGN